MARGVQSAQLIMKTACALRRIGAHSTTRLRRRCIAEIHRHAIDSSNPDAMFDRRTNHLHAICRQTRWQQRQREPDFQRPLFCGHSLLQDE